MNRAVGARTLVRFTVPWDWSGGLKSALRFMGSLDLQIFDAHWGHEPTTRTADAPRQQQGRLEFRRTKIPTLLSKVVLLRTRSVRGPVHGWR